MASASVATSSESFGDSREEMGEGGEELRKETEALRKEIEALKRKEMEMENGKGEEGGAEVPPPPIMASGSSDEFQRQIDALREQVRELEIDKKKMQSRAMASASIASSSDSFSDSRGASMAKNAMIKTGSLMKKSKYWKKWESRSVALDAAGNLMWDGGGKHRNFITLTLMTQVEVVDVVEGEGKWEFSITADGRKIDFAASEEEVRRDWVKKIRDFCEG
jgi:hypothetical protein